MSAQRTAEESKIECIERMGEPLGTLYFELWQELAWLHFKWGEYNLLFGKGENRIQLMNETAPFFFNVVQRVIWEDSILHIARLTDKTHTGGRRNLTLCLLPELIAIPELQTRVLASIETTREATDFCRDWRNRHIAHRDLDLALNRNVPSLKAADKSKMDVALKAIGAVLDIVGLHYLNSTTSFSIPFSPDGADRLLRVLDDGEKYNDLREKALNSDSYNDEYFKPKYV